MDRPTDIKNTPLIKKIPATMNSSGVEGFIFSAKAILPKPIKSTILAN